MSKYKLFFHKLKIRGIYARFIIIVFLPILLLQLINTHFFYQRHWESVSSYLRNSLVGELSLIIDDLNQGELALAQKHGQSLNIKVESLSTDLTSQLPSVEIEPALQPIVQQLEDAKIPLQAMGFTADKDEIFIIYQSVTLKKDKENSSELLMKEEPLYYLEFGSKRLLSKTTALYMVIMLSATFIIFFISFMFLKNQIKIIVKLSKVAENFGNGLRVSTFRPSGPFEIRSLGHSLLRMQKRISRYIQHRTELLAHIAHDLRTPLTRLKLEVSMLKDTTKQESLNRNINEIDEMIQSYLTFAKGEGNEAISRVDVISLLRDIKQDYDKIISPNLTITIKADAHKLLYETRKNALKRAFVNIIDNAVKYGTSKVDIEINSKGRHLRILVADDGPGIEEGKFHNMLKPFTKSAHSKGHGLGLAIVSSIIQSNGGQLKLDRSKLGGLAVLVKLPLKNSKS